MKIERFDFADLEILLYQEFLQRSVEKSSDSLERESEDFMLVSGFCVKLTGCCLGTGSVEHHVGDFFLSREFFQVLY